MGERGFEKKWGNVMARYIDADKLREYWLENGVNEHVYNTNSVLDSIDYQPTADVAKVVHGEWKHEFLECSVCKRNISEIYDADSYMTYGIEDELNYCPYCGAKMDGKEDENV